MHTVEPDRPICARLGLLSALLAGLAERPEMVSGICSALARRGGGAVTPPLWYGTPYFSVFAEHVFPVGLYVLWGEAGQVFPDQRP